MHVKFFLEKFYNYSKDKYNTKNSLNKNPIILITNLFMIILILTTLLVLIIGGRDTKIVNKTYLSPILNQKYFDTPEEAAIYFTKCISENDFEAALNAFAIDNVAENFDFNSSVDSIEGFIPSTMLAPNYTQYELFNKLKLLYQASYQIKIFVYSFNYEYDMGQILSLSQNDLTPEKVYNSLNPSNVTNLNLVKLIYVNPEYQDSDKYKDLVKNQMDIYGFIDTEEYFSLYELNGKYYYGGFEFVKYKKGWQIYSLSTKVGGTSTDGEVTQTTIDFSGY